jgi:DNA polymerase-3 subunit delta
MITIENLEKELRTGNLKNIYVLYGEELFLLENCLKKIKKNFGELIKGINYIQIDQNNIRGLVSELQTPAFGYPQKLIIVKNCKVLMKESKKRGISELKEIKEKITEYLKNNILIDNILVFIEENVEKTELLEEIQKQNGIICNFEFQKPAQIEKRLKKICNAYKVNISPATISYLIEYSGTNMQNLINEIRKLIEYAGENGTIKNEDIDELCTKTIDSTIFELTDNLGKKNTDKAIEILKDLLDSKEPIQKILITLYNHLKKLYLLKIAEFQNRDIVISLNLKPNQTFLVNKYKMQSKYFTIEELKNILNEFINLDFNYKTGKIDINIGLESIICRYFS